MRTLIRGGLVVVWSNGRHGVVRRADVVIEDDKIAGVGHVEPLEGDVVIDAQGCLVIPGLINTHTHWGTGAPSRMLVDAGRPDFFHVGYVNWYALPRGSQGLGSVESEEVGGLWTFAELLRFGCTSVLEAGGGTDALVDAAKTAGIRLFTGPGFESRSYGLDGKGRIEFREDETDGQRGLERAIDFVRRHRGSRTVSPVLVPNEVVTCSPGLLEKTARAADDLDVRVTVHAGMNLLEFHEVMRRRLKTPVAELQDTGLLGPRLVIGHCLLTDSHPFAHVVEKMGDVELVARAGASVAHCPVAYARLGNALHSFSRYLRAGVNMSLGTDGWPRDLIQEARVAALMSKVVDESFLSGSAGEMFDALTLGGATALGRDDLGRICTGATADVTTVRLAGQLHVGPFLDPIRALVYTAVGSDVRTVLVGGRVVVADGQVLTVDMDSLYRQVDRAAAHIWDSFGTWHGGAPTAEEYVPPALPWISDEELRDLLPDGY